jgi:hypothetical protein
MTKAEENQIDRIPTPNLDRVEEVREESEKVGDVLHWIQEETEYSLDLSGNGIEQVLAEYYGIDLEEAQRETARIKNAILDE